eukprot:scaffold7147_cov130-Isochrysis_galbana.AAC.9
MRRGGGGDRMPRKLREASRQAYALALRGAETCRRSGIRPGRRRWVGWSRRVLRRKGDVDRRAHLAALCDAVVDRVVQELVEEVVVELGAGVDGGVGLLGQDVVEARGPLARAEAGGDGAVVHHVRDAARVHVRVERVDRLDDRLVDHLGEHVAVVDQAVDLGHHGGAVDAGCEGVHRRVALALFGGAARRAHLLADLPCAGAVELPHRPGEPRDSLALVPLDGVDHVADLVAARHGVVALFDDVAGRHVRGAVGRLEDVLLGVGQLLVHGQDALVADGGGEWAGDHFSRVLEGLLGRHAQRLVPPEERLDDSVHGPEQDAALAKDVGAELGRECRLEDVRRADANSPGQGALGGPAGGVLVHGEGGIDARPVDLAPELVQPPHRRAHALWCDHHHVNVLREVLACQPRSASRVG